ncbi:MAG TPA: hypothetical protein VMF05_12935 [Stellaceae bacterium]|nr:hypothetical protein [Stellaceae bacterium]
MDQRSIVKHLRRWHRRDKRTVDRHPGDVNNETNSGQRVHSPTTGSGLTVESQIRKVWDPTRGGGLPVFLRVADEFD